MYQTYFASIVNNVSGIISLIPIVAKGLESVSSIGDVLIAEDIEDNRKKKKIKQVSGDIEFQDVTFTYADDTTPVLSHLNFHIKPGETIAFVDPSGAGKTTILNMVIGFSKATEGQVLIDGYNMADLNLHSYRKHIAVVPQNSILFSGTIRENITYGLDNISEEDLQQVLISSNLKELVDSLPQGLDTISEKQIQEATRNLTKDRTTLIVAHRLSTIRDADRIAVIKHGGVAEFGTYEELMEKKGSFYEMREMQM